MKQKYFSPEFEVTLLLAEDVLATSPDEELDNEVDINGDIFFD